MANNDKIGSAFFEIRATMGKLRNDLRRVEGAVRGSVGRIKKSFREIDTVALAGLSASLGLFVRSSVNSFRRFEAEMNRVKVLTGATGKEFDMLSKKAKQLGQTTAFSAGQVADGMGFLAQAGFETNEILSAIGPSLDLAAASGQDLATTADQMSNIMQGFALNTDEAGRTADVLALGASSANTNVTQLAEAMKFAAPVANSLGLSLEETTAVMGTLGNSAIQSGMAGTQLRQAMLSLLDPTDDAKKVLKEYDIVLTKTDGSMKNFIDILQELKNKGLKQKDLAQLFETRTLTGILTLLDQGPKKIRAFANELNNAGGTAAKQAQARMEGLNGALIELSSAFEGLQIALFEGEAGKGLEAIADTFTEVLRAITSLNPKLLEFISVGTVVTTVIAGIALALSLLGGPISLVVVGIGLITSALIVFKEEIISTIVDVAIGAIDHLLSTLQAFVDVFASIDLTGVFQKMSDKITVARQNIRDMGEDIKSLTDPSTGKMSKLVEQANELEEAFKNAGDAASGLDRNLPSVPNTNDKENKGDDPDKEENKVGSAIGTALSNKVSELLPSELRGPFRSIFNELGDDFGDKLAPVFEEGASALGDGLSSILGGLGDALGGAASGIGGLLGGIGSGIGNFFGGFFADGGRPPTGKVSVVGERGPELFVPDGAGTIIPNHDLGGGGGSVNVNLQPIFVGVDAQIQSQINAATPQIVASAKNAVADAMSRGDKKFRSS